MMSMSEPQGRRSTRRFLLTLVAGIAIGIGGSRLTTFEARELSASDFERELAMMSTIHSAQVFHLLGTTSTHAYLLKTCPGLITLMGMDWVSFVYRTPLDGLSVELSGSLQKGVVPGAIDLEPSSE